MKITTPKLTALCKTFDATETVYAVVASNEIIVPMPCLVIDHTDENGEEALVPRAAEPELRKKYMTEITTWSDDACVHISEDEYGLSYVMYLNEDYEEY